MRCFNGNIFGYRSFNICPCDTIGEEAVTLVPIVSFKVLLTLNVPCSSESCIEIKIKAFKAFIKPFEAPQRSLKIKI